MEIRAITCKTNISQGDEDHERRTQAEVLLNAYSRELERRRLAAGAAGIPLSNDGQQRFFRLRYAC